MGRAKNHLTREEFQEQRFKDEVQFEAWVISILRVNGWRITSMKDSRRQRWDTDRGIPDVIAVHPIKRKLLFAELKMPKKNPTPDQDIWLRFLSAVEMEAPLTLQVVVWRPKDQKYIIEYAGGKVPIG